MDWKPVIALAGAALGITVETFIRKKVQENYVNKRLDERLTFYEEKYEEKYKDCTFSYTEPAK